MSILENRKELLEIKNRIIELKVQQKIERQNGGYPLDINPKNKDMEKYKN